MEETIQALERAQLKTKISVEVSNACGKWAKEDTPTADKLETLINDTAEKILTMVEAYEN